MNAPCKGCTDRRGGCHGGCARYAEYREAVDDIRENRQIEEQSRAYEKEFVTKMHLRFEMRKRRR